MDDDRDDHFHLNLDRLRGGRQSRDDLAKSPMVPTCWRKRTVLVQDGVVPSLLRGAGYRNLIIRPFAFGKE